MKFYENDVAIVSYSGVFPNCEDEDIFFKRLLNGEVLIKDLTLGEEKNPVQVSYHFSEDKKSPDTTYSKYAAKISLDQIRTWAERNELDTRTSSSMEIIMHELFRRMEAKTPGLFDRENSECIIAMSTGDPDPIRIGQRQVYELLKKKIDFSAAEKSRIESFLATFENHPRRPVCLTKDNYTSLSFESLRDRFGIDGSCSYIDAACASSLAAVMIAVKRLQEHDSDLVISGGIDLGSTLMTLIAFSKLHIMSEKIMNPFDISADGINQGEGAGFFALMRLKDAREAGFPVHGVIRNCDGSSDGVLGGMVEPTEYGQFLAYERAYQDVPARSLSYLEAHGTGTKLGDKTELASTAKFFHPLPPVGSVKANAGHTIGAAGATSMVKCLKIIETKTIPKMPNFRKIDKQNAHVVPKENMALPADETTRIGISSFGFGGANFHMVIDEYRGEDLFPSSKGHKKDFKFLLNGFAEIDLKYVYELFSASRFKMPPKSMKYADPAVLGGILAVDKLFSSLRLKLNQKQKEKIGVISNSSAYLERLVDGYERIAYLEIIRRLDDKAKIEKLSQEMMPNDLTITEDTFMGSLNNLIAGRITKDFDLKGPNFNVACEKTSLGLTMSYVRSLLKSSSGAYIIINTDEDLKAEGVFGLERSAVRAFLVSDLEFALSADLPIAREISNISLKRQGSEHVHA